MENKKNKEAIVFIGIQASGKSSYYQKYFWNYTHVNLDTLHTRNKENLMLQECLEKQESFVVDNTNPTAADRAKYISLAKENGYMVYGYYFRSSISECIDRNKLREGIARLPDKALVCTHSKLEIPQYEEGFDKLFYVQIIDDKFVTEVWDETS